MEDGDTESENASRVIQDFVFWCRKKGSINGYFLQVYNKGCYFSLHTVCLESYFHTTSF